jgi:hypothetical protein
LRASGGRYAKTLYTKMWARKNKNRPISGFFTKTVYAQVTNFIPVRVSTLYTPGTLKGLIKLMDSLCTKYIRYIQGVPELAPQRKQACADNKRNSKLSKINFLLAQITEL